MTHTDLKPCPECRGSGLELTSVDLDDGVSPCWACHGDSMVQPEMIGTPDTAPSHGDLIAEAEAWQTAQNNLMGKPMGAPNIFSKLIDALRAAEAREQKLREALEKLHHAVCGPTGFAESVRYDSGKAYPWPALDIADDAARRALGGSNDPSA